METTELIEFPEFQKVKLKVGKILSASKVDNSDKLLKFQMDFGDKEVQIVSGIAEYYTEPEELVGLKVLAVTNLKPVKLRGEVSEGMLLSADVADRYQLIVVDDNIPSGSDVH